MKKLNRTSQIIILCLALFMIVGIIATTSSQTPNTNQVQQDDDPPTPIQLGIMTEKQKKNSRLYKGAKNKKSPLSKRDNVKILFESPYTDTSIVYSEKTTSSEYDFLKYLSCKSDTVVLAHIDSKATQLSEDTKLTFTDYEINVLNILKSKKNNIQNGISVTVTNIGGAVSIDGRTIETIIKTVPNPKVGKDYLMFLTYLPESDSYKLADINGLYQVSGTSIKRNRPTPNTFSNIVGDVKTAIDFIQANTNNCSQETN